jgi:hypothetical protein
VQRGRGGPLTGAGRAVSRAGGEATQPPWACLPRPPSHEGRGRGIRSLGCGGVSLNTKRPGVALAPGSGSHLPWAVPGAPKSRAPLWLASRPASTRRLPPHLTLVNTSTANVLRSSPAKVYWRRPLLPPLLPRSCLRRHARLLCSYLGARHAPLLRSCLGEQKWPHFRAWSEDAMKPREVCPRRRHQGRHTP